MAFFKMVLQLAKATARDRERERESDPRQSMRARKHFAGWPSMIFG
jgi:hypothetical protein